MYQTCIRKKVIFKILLSIFYNETVIIFVKYIRRAIYHATFRDAASGGVVRVYHMKPTGFEVISEQDCKELHYLYAAEK